MDTEEKYLRIIVAITVIYVFMIIILKITSTSINSIPIFYYAICGLSAQHMIKKQMDNLRYLIENKYPELSNKISGSQDNISSFRISGLVQFGSKTGYEEVDKQIVELKEYGVRMAFIIFLSFGITVISYLV